MTIAPVSQTRLITLSNVSTALYANVFGAAIGVTTDADLSMHGGEDAVHVRTVGRLGFTTGRVNVGAGAAATTFLMRVALVQTDTVNVGATPSIMPFEFVSGTSLGQDNILWMSDVIVPGTSVLEVTGAVAPGATSMDYRLDLDVKVKRKLQSDRHIYLWFQSVFDDVVTVDADFRLWGGLRTLLMRSR